MLLTWTLFVIAFFFGMLVMAFAVSATPLFLPLFLLALDFPLGAALAATLIVKVFVYSTGLRGFFKHRCISYRLASQILLLAIPACIIGVILSTIVPVAVSLALFGVLLVVFAVLIIHPEHEILFRQEDEPSKGYVRSTYGIAHNIELVSSTFSGVFMGLVGSGTGEINNYVFLKKYRMPGPLATGTTVFIITVLALVAASGHSLALFTLENGTFSRMVASLAWIIPGAALGAALGTELSQSIPGKLRERFVAVLFLAIAVLMFVTAASI